MIRFARYFSSLNKHIKTNKVEGKLSNQYFSYQDYLKQLDKILQSPQNPIEIQQRVQFTINQAFINYKFNTYNMAKFLNFVNEHALWKSLKNINIQEKVMSLNLDYIQNQNDIIPLLSHSLENIPEINKYFIQQSFSELLKTFYTNTDSFQTLVLIDALNFYFKKYKTLESQENSQIIFRNLIPELVDRIDRLNPYIILKFTELYWIKKELSQDNIAVLFESFEENLIEYLPNLNQFLIRELLKNMRKGVVGYDLCRAIEQYFESKLIFFSKNTIVEFSNFAQSQAFQASEEFNFLYMVQAAQNFSRIRNINNHYKHVCQLGDIVANIINLSEINHDRNYWLVNDNSSSATRREFFQKYEEDQVEQKITDEIISYLKKRKQQNDLMIIWQYIESIELTLPYFHSELIKYFQEQLFYQNLPYYHFMLRVSNFYENHNFQFDILNPYLGKHIEKSKHIPRGFKLFLNQIFDINQSQFEDEELQYLIFSYRNSSYQEYLDNHILQLYKKSSLSLDTLKFITNYVVQLRQQKKEIDPSLQETIDKNITSLINFEQKSQKYDNFSFFLILEKLFLGKFLDHADKYDEIIVKKYKEGQDFQQNQGRFQSKVLDTQSSNLEVEITSQLQSYFDFNKLDVKINTSVYKIGQEIDIELVSPTKQSPFYIQIHGPVHFYVNNPDKYCFISYIKNCVLEQILQEQANFLIDNLFNQQYHLYNLGIVVATIQR